MSKNLGYNKTIWSKSGILAVYTVYFNFIKIGIK